MNSKNQVHGASKAVSDAKTDTQTATAAVAETLPSSPSQQAVDANAQNLGQADAGTSSNAIPSDIIELLTELRDTVKSINPRKHTAKTLRRALSNVSAIMADIDALYQQD